MRRLLILAALLCGCPVVREAALRAAPGVPDPSGCTEGAYRCNAGVPERCSSTGRWWATTARAPSGEQRRCPGNACVVAPDGVAYCGVPDAGAP